MDNYIVLEHIGEGSFGKVYKARRKNTGFTVAMKFITKHGKSEKDLKNLRQEIGILRKLNHENIILMFDTFETEREFCVVTEYAQGELFDILQVRCIAVLLRLVASPGHSVDGQKDTASVELECPCVLRIIYARYYLVHAYCTVAEPDQY